MGSLNGRVERLEARQPRTVRCVVCRDWPSVVTRYAGPPRQGRPADATPDACPACGWQPFRVIIEIPEPRTWD